MDDALPSTNSVSLVFQTRQIERFQKRQPGKGGGFCRTSGFFAETCVVIQPAQKRMGQMLG